MRFKDREDAGERLAEKLSEWKSRDDVVVCALPRGGVPVGYKIAESLGAPLDLVITRKIGHPSNPEYAVCAISEGGETLCNEEESSRLDSEWLAAAKEKAMGEARRRRETYMSGRARPDMKNKTVILVDDGIATGLTFRLAVRLLRRFSPAKIIAALPVVPSDTAEILREEADSLEALHIPDVFSGAIGAYYDSFPQLEDEDVIHALNNLDKK